jgi:hypothetical protein
MKFLIYCSWFHWIWVCRIGVIHKIVLLVITTNFNFSNKIKRAGNWLGRVGVGVGPAQAVIQVEGGKIKERKRKGERGPGAGPMCMGNVAQSHARVREHLLPAYVCASSIGTERPVGRGLTGGRRRSAARLRRMVEGRGSPRARSASPSSSSTAPPVGEFFPATPGPAVAALVSGGPGRCGGTG